MCKREKREVGDLTSAYESGMVNKDIRDGSGDANHSIDPLSPSHYFIKPKNPSRDAITLQLAGRLQEPGWPLSSAGLSGPQS